MMNKPGMMKQNISWVLSGFFAVLMVCLGLLAVSVGVLLLGQVLAYVSESLFQRPQLEMIHYVVVILAMMCILGLGIPIIVLARNIQRSAENFSLLQFEEDPEDFEDDDGEDVDFENSDEELNEFLRKLHKTRNIGPFMPSPKTLNDLCPCGSGLKYKDCCGKSWI